MMLHLQKLVASRNLIILELITELVNKKEKILKRSAKINYLKVKNCKIYSQNQQPFYPKNISKCFLKSLKANIFLFPSLSIAAQ